MTSEFELVEPEAVDGVGDASRVGRRAGGERSDDGKERCRGHHEAGVERRRVDRWSEHGPEWTRSST